MTKKKLNIDEVIIRYLDGYATKTEKKRLLDWLNQSGENLREYTGIRDVWIASNSVSSILDETETALNKLKKQVRISDVGKSKSTFLPLTYATMKIAAAILLLFTVGATFYKLGENQSQTETVVYNRLLTAKGGKGHFVLPDSTVVWLNSNSMLEYPEAFSDSTREVHLEGEAYFEVKRNEQKPFHVHAGDINIEVLGTHFSVDNYSFRTGVEAVLAEGSIKVTGSNMSHPHVLIPGQLINYDKKSAQTVVQTVDAANYTSWIQDDLVFDNAQLADVIVNLKKWYVTDIECDSSLEQTLSLTFSVRSGESLNDILEAMRMIIPIKYYWEKEVLHIVPLK